MVVVPSSAHADLAAAMAPHLRDGQVIILHPGRTCGAIEVAAVLARGKLPGGRHHRGGRHLYLCQSL